MAGPFSTCGIGKLPPGTGLKKSLAGSSVFGELPAASHPLRAIATAVLKMPYQTTSRCGRGVWWRPRGCSSLPRPSRRSSVVSGDRGASIPERLTAIPPVDRGMALGLGHHSATTAGLATATNMNGPAGLVSSFPGREHGWKRLLKIEQNVLATTRTVMTVLLPASSIPQRCSGVVPAPTA